jgi:hypothetical protein
MPSILKMVVFIRFLPFNPSDLKFIDSIYALEVPQRSSDKSVTPWARPRRFGLARGSDA